MQFELKIPFFGFESLKSMKLTKIDDVFMQLDNADEEKPSFTLINPFVLKNYEIEIPTAVKNLLEINENSNILIYNIVVIQKPLDQSAINFAAPLIFNTDNQTMAQVILEGKFAKDHGIAERICDFMNKNKN